MAQGIRKILVASLCLLSSGVVGATQIFTLQLDPSASWVQDRSWVEYLPNSSDAIYHQGGRSALTGRVRVLLGRAYPYSIEIEGLDVFPGALPSGRQVSVDIAAQPIANGVFPDESIDLFGGICACISLIDPFAPQVAGVFNGGELSVDFSTHSQLLFGVGVHWIGGDPSGQARNSYAYHIEAAPVSAPPVAMLLLWGLGALTARERSSRSRVG